MSQFNTLLTALQNELEGQKELRKLLAVEKTAIIHIEEEKLEALQKTKSNLLAKVERLATVREGIVRAILQIEDATKAVKIADAVQKCTDSKLKRNLNIIVTSLKNISKEVKELNAYNSKMINQALGVLSSTLAIVRSTPGSELPTYGDKGELKSSSKDPGLQKRKTLVTTA